MQPYDLQQFYGPEEILHEAKCLLYLHYPPRTSAVSVLLLSLLGLIPEGD